MKLPDPAYLNVKKIDMTEHAYIRAAERLKLKDRNEALGTIRKKIQRTECFGLTLAEDGSISYLLANRDGEVFHLGEDLSKILTIYKVDKIRYTPLKDKVEGLHRKELRKLRIREGALKKKIAVRKLELEYEMAQVKLRQYKTRSSNVKAECENRMKEIQNELSGVQQMERELNSILEKATQLSRFIVSIS